MVAGSAAAGDLVTNGRGKRRRRRRSRYEWSGEAPPPAISLRMVGGSAAAGDLVTNGRGKRRRRRSRYEWSRKSLILIVIVVRRQFVLPVFPKNIPVFAENLSVRPPTSGEMLGRIPATGMCRAL
jgi:hypothetical protein